MIITHILPPSDRSLIGLALNRLAESIDFSRDLRRQAESLAEFLAPARELVAEIDDPPENG
jgi:hypothetical protein